MRSEPKQRGPPRTSANARLARRFFIAEQFCYRVVVLAALAAPANNDRSPRYMEKALAAIHQALRPGQAIKLEYGLCEGRVALLCRFSHQFKEVVLGPLIANYPRAAISFVDEDRPDSAMHDKIEWSCDVMLAPELFPILRHAQFEDLLNGNYADPIDSLLRAVRPAGGGECRVDVLATPASPRMCRMAKHAVEILDREFFRSHPRLAEFFAHNVLRPRSHGLIWLANRLTRRGTRHHGAQLDVSAGRLHDREADLQAAADKIGGHLFTVGIRIIVRATSQALAVERVQAVIGALGSFTRSRLATFTASSVKRDAKELAWSRGFILSHEELATLWHPPSATVGAERMQVSTFTEMEPPTAIYSGEEEGAVKLGQVRFREDDRFVGIARDDRRRHVHVIGRTGTGKTTMVLNMVHADLQAGHGLAVVDPHGDLAVEIARLVPNHRTNEVILFDAADPNFAISFNPLACHHPSRLDQVTSGVVSAFKKLHDSWGPRLENTLRNAVFATVEQSGTFLSLLQLLTDEAYRERTVPRIQDEVVRTFWMQEFAGWTKAYRTEAVAAITNKIQPFLTNRCIRAIVSQAGPSLDLRQVMDEGKVLIVNLSKGRLGEDNAALLGAFLVTSIQQAAMTRADVPEDERRDFYLYIDEFQNFITTSFESILSEARKYRLNLTVSHQYRAQLNEATASAIAGNVGSIIAFAVGNEDAEWLATAIAKYPGQLTAADMTNLPRYTAYAKLLIDGMPSDPFSIRTLPPTAITEDRLSIVVEQSRRQHARPIANHGTSRRSPVDQT